MKSCLYQEFPFTCVERKLKKIILALFGLTLINFVMQNAAVLLYLAGVSFVACFLGEFSVLLLFLVLSFSL
jgi:uncharacterized membrane protein